MLWEIRDRPLPKMDGCRVFENVSAVRDRIGRSEKKEMHRKVKETETVNY